MNGDSTTYYAVGFNWPRFWTKVRLLIITVLPLSSRFFYVRDFIFKDFGSKVKLWLILCFDFCLVSDGSWGNWFSLIWYKLSSVAFLVFKFVLMRWRVRSHYSPSSETLSLYYIFYKMLLCFFFYFNIEFSCDPAIKLFRSLY